MLIVPTVTGIRTFIGRPSVPHFSISPATCQGQAADAVAALAHARNLRPLALEILCVPRFAHLQKILNTARMKNRKYNLLPYETIVKAAAGEPEAVNTVIQTYTGYIKYLSYFQGSINDDIQDYLKASLMEALPKFRFDR